MENEYFMLYPIHMDSSRAVSKGRKYAIDICVSKPRHTEIKNALDAIKIDYKEDAKVRHPKDSTTFGRFSIKKNGPKSQIVKNICQLINSEREKKKGTEVKNLLNLVPKKKKSNKNK